MSDVLIEKPWSELLFIFFPKERNVTMKAEKSAEVRLADLGYTKLGRLEQNLRKLAEEPSFKAGPAQQMTDTVACLIKSKLDVLR